MTSVINTLGVTFTSSTDKTIKVLEPSVKPSVISTLSKQTAEVARVSIVPLCTDYFEYPF